MTMSELAYESSQGKEINIKIAININNGGLSGQWSAQCRGVLLTDKRLRSHSFRLFAPVIVLRPWPIALRHPAENHHQHQGARPE